jgi:hypothetical protein
MGGPMSKFKFKLKLQGLELEMEGSRDDIPLMAQNLGNQLAGLMQPAADMATGESSGTEPAQIIDHSPNDKAKLKKRKKRGGNAQAAADESPAIEWQHDASRYGTPQQSWSTAKKAIWLLHVVSKETHLSQLTAPQIADTFNRKFRQAGTIRATNVSRDLGAAKLKTPALTGEDTAKAVSEWFLTDAGSKSAQDSIKEVTQTNGAN